MRLFILLMKFLVSALIQITDDVITPFHQFIKTFLIVGTFTKFMIIHNGSQVKVINTYKQAVDFILNQKKTIKKKSRK